MLAFSLILTIAPDYFYGPKVMKPQMWIAIGVNTFNVLTFPLAIHWLGPDGAPISLTVFNSIQAVLQCVVTQCYVEDAAWPKWSMVAASQGWGEVLQLALPSALCMWSEWWGWETTLFMAVCLSVEWLGSGLSVVCQWLCSVCMLVLVLVRVLRLVCCCLYIVFITCDTVITSIILLL